MKSDWDQDDFSRADEFIDLANSQIEESSKGKVSASIMFAAARFNVWLSATGFNDRVKMASMKEETLEYFVAQYREALIQNFEDYSANFSEYMSKT